MGLRLAKEYTTIRLTRSDWTRPIPRLPGLLRSAVRVSLMLSVPTTRSRCHGTGYPQRACTTMTVYSSQQLWLLRSSSHFRLNAVTREMDDLISGAVESAADYQICPPPPLLTRGGQCGAGRSLSQGDDATRSPSRTRGQGQGQRGADVPARGLDVQWRGKVSIYTKMHGIDTNRIRTSKGRFST